MIQKIFITGLIIFIFIFSIRFFKKIVAVNNHKNQKNNKDEDIIDLQKDPQTNEYKPKDK